MKKLILLAVSAVVLTCNLSAQTYNTLWIPDTMSGTTFNLNLVDTFAQFRTGNQTITAGVDNKFWGPTLFFNTNLVRGGRVMAIFFKKALKQPALTTITITKVL